MKLNKKRARLLWFLIIFLTSPSFFLNAQDTIIDLSLERVIRIELNNFNKSDSKEFLITDYINNKHYYDFANYSGLCKYSRFSPNGTLLLSGFYSINDSIEYYTTNILDPDTNTLYEKDFYRIKPKRVGEWIYYSESGELTKTEQYKDDVLVDETYPK